MATNDGGKKEYISLIFIFKKKKNTDVIKRILSTSMKHPKCKIPIRKLHSIINSPKRSSIRIRYSRKTTTRSCIGFKHVKRFASPLSDRSTVEVGLDEVNCRGVGCVGWEDGLRINSGAVGCSSELGCTVVVGITGG